MKIKLLTNKSLFVAVLAASLFLFGRPGQASAATSQTASSKPPTAYTYIARPGDNLSIIARRSVQLYAQAKHIKLSPAVAMYCETNTVQKVGSHLLSVGESVTIPFDTLQKYIASGRKLTAQQLVAWNFYAQLASFDLADLNPTNKTKAQSAAATHTSSASTNKPTSQTNNNSSKKSSSSSNSLAWYGWVVVAVFAVATVYYFTRLKV